MYCGPASHPQPLACRAHGPYRIPAQDALAAQARAEEEARRLKATAAAAAERGDAAARARAAAAEAHAAEAEARAAAAAAAAEDARRQRAEEVGPASVCGVCGEMRCRVPACSRIVRCGPACLLSAPLWGAAALGVHGSCKLLLRAVMLHMRVGTLAAGPCEAADVLYWCWGNKSCCVNRARHWVAQAKRADAAEAAARAATAAAAAPAPQQAPDAQKPAAPDLPASPIVKSGPEQRASPAPPEPLPRRSENGGVRTRVLAVRLACAGLFQRRQTRCRPAAADWHRYHVCLGRTMSRPMRGCRQRHKSPSPSSSGVL